MPVAQDVPWRPRWKLPPWRLWPTLHGEGRLATRIVSHCQLALSMASAQDNLSTFRPTLHAEARKRESDPGVSLLLARVR